MKWKIVRHVRVISVKKKKERERKKNENGDRRGEWLDGEHTVSTRKRVNISV